MHNTPNLHCYENFKISHLVVSDRRVSLGKEGVHNTPNLNFENFKTSDLVANERRERRRARGVGFSVTDEGPTHDRRVSTPDERPA